MRSLRTDPAEPARMGSSAPWTRHRYVSSATVPGYAIGARWAVGVNVLAGRVPLNRMG